MEDALNALVLFTNFVLLPASTYGAQLALGALGVTLIYGILRFANFAHGDLMAAGTMVVILVTWGLQDLGLSLGPLPTALLALPVGMAAAALIALGTDRMVYRFHRKRKAPPVVFTIVSVGVMFIYTGLVRFIIGPGDQRFSDAPRFLFTARDFKEWTGLEQGFGLRTTQALTLVVALIVVVWVFRFLAHTRTGKAMRAYSDNEDLAGLSGIEPDKVVRAAWIIAASLACIAGMLYGLDRSFKPFTYQQLLLPIFASAVVGGIGQPIGAIVGAFVVAFSEVLLTYAYRGVAAYLLPPDWMPEGLLQILATEYKVAVSFVILVIVLLIRPTGLFKGRTL